MAATAVLLLSGLVLIQPHRAATAGTASPWDVSGRDFVFSFPYPPNTSVRPYLIATAQAPNVNTRVRFDLPGHGCSHRADVGYGERALFSLPSVKTRHARRELGSLSGIRLDIDENTVVVRANSSITLQCVTGNRADRFLVHPTKALGLEYFIASSPVARLHLFTVSATQDNTSVDINMRFPELVNKATNKTQHINRVLNRNQTIYVSSLFDLTGVRVTSSQPVAVVSGSQLGDTVLAQQLPPVDAWGHEFIMTRSGYPTSSLQIHRIVIPSPNTSLSISSNSTTLEVKVADIGATWFDHLVQSEDHLEVLSSDKPVMVVRYTSGSTLLIMPMEQYRSNGSIQIEYMLSEPAEFVLNFAYFCQEEPIVITENSSHDKRQSSRDSTKCVRTVGFLPSPGDRKSHINILTRRTDTTFVWVDTYDTRAVTGSYHVAATMQLQSPHGEESSFLAFPTGRSTSTGVSAETSWQHCLSPTGKTTSNSGDTTTTPTTSGTPLRTKRPTGSDDTAIVVSLSLSVAIVLAVIVGLCVFMKKNKMFPSFSQKTKRTYDVTNAILDGQQAKREMPMRSLTEAIPLQNRYSVSLPDLRPMLFSSGSVGRGQQARFLHIQRAEVKRLAPIAEHGAALAGSDARLDRHDTFVKPVEHTYLSVDHQPQKDHRPAPSPVVDRRPPPPPPPSVIPQISGCNTQALDGSATGQFASIGRRRHTPAKPIPVEFVFKQPETETQWVV
ncbi:uncharacterized protein LOC110983426 [Acanthaster planci]|uniref:Uncharacterized protein LOC110983426 n=1 Tax=Acanthaster planci TaxID=133434 RepID=A0A8B7Z4V0_ACAPL|nr:uncharacterized protein LOC110983426 [Acanthaster planci]